MRKRYELALLFLCINFVTQAQTWLWAKDAVSGSLEQGNDVAVDSLGNAYVAGYFRDDISAAYGPSFANTYGSQDGFVAKYSPSGVVLWAFKLGGSGTDMVNGIVSDNAGNLYITGYFQNTAQFKGTSTSQSLSLSSAGGEDAFIAKYNAAGELQWVKQGSNSGKAFGYKITKNSSKLFVSGYFDGGGSFAFPGSTTISSQGNVDAFFSVHDLSGNCLSLKKVGSGSEDYGYDITADESNYYVIGSFRGASVGFYRTNTVTDTTITNLNSGDYDVFYAAYSISTGNLQWARRIGSSGSFDDEGKAITQDANYLYLAGGVGPNPDFPGVGTITVNAGECIFVSKVSKTNGQNIWAKVEPDGGSSTAGHCNDIKTRSDKIWVTGEFYLTTNFSGTSINSTGSDDIFVASYKTDGTLRYVKKAGSSGSEKGLGLDVYQNGTVYVSGLISGGAVFDATTLNASNGQNIGVGKLACNTGSGSISGSTTIFSGQSANLALNFTGTPPYDYIVSDGTVTYSGSTSSSSAIVSVSPSSTKTYTLISLTTGSTCDVLQDNLSGSAVVTVTQVITNNSIAASQLVCQGQVPSSLTGTTPLGGNGVYAYTWEQSTDSISWTPASGVNNLQNYSPGLLSVKTFFRRFVVSGGFNGYSNVVVITILNSGVNNITGTQSLCVGQSANPLTGSLPGLTGSFTYNWEQSLDNFIWLPATGTNNQQNYSPGSVSAVTYYRRKVNSTCGTNTSNVVVITIPDAIANNTIAANHAICFGQPANLIIGSTPTGGNSSFNFLWQQSSDNLTWTTAPGISNNIDYDPGVLSATMYFRRQVTSGPCTPSTSNTITVTVLPIIMNNIVSVTQTTICNGQIPSTLNGTVPAGGNGSYSYLWEQSIDSAVWTAASGSNNLQNYTSPALNSSLFFRRTVSSGSCNSLGNNIYINVLPVISNNTISGNQTICSGQTPSAFSVNTPAGGNNSYNYLWEESSDNSVWSAAAGANNQMNYSAPALSATRYYRRTVSSGVCSPNISPVITITVLPVTSNNAISSAQTICAGQTPLTLTGTAPSGGNGGYVYLWEQSADNTSWSTATGTNSQSTYSPTSLTSTMYYRRSVNSAMCASHLSNSIAVTVLPVIANNTISSSQTICSGQTPGMINGSGPSGGDNTYTYLWEQSSDNTSWSNAFGTNNNDSYSPAALTSTTYYRRAVSSAMCSSNTSPSVTITVLPVVSNNNISSSQTICSGQTPLTLNGTNPTGGNNSYTYLWEQSSDNAIWSVASGTNSQNTYSPPALTDTMYYRRKVSSAMCSSNFSSSITITVLPLIANNNISSPQTLCSGQTPFTLNGTAPLGGNNTFTYVWEQSSDTATWMAATGTNSLASYSPGALTSTAYFRRTVSSAMCASSSSSSVAITVLPVITNNTISSPQTICSGQTPLTLNGSAPSGGDNTYTYLWEQSSDNVVWFAAVGTNNSDSYSPAALTSSTYYRRTVSSAMCSSQASASLLITVLPVITNNVISSAQTLCSGQTPLMLNGTAPSGGNNSYTYSWEQSSDNIIWSSASGTNNLSSYSASALSSSVYYRRTVSSAMCSSNTSASVAITVLPAVSNNTINSSQTICSGQTPLILNGSTPSGGDNTFTYLWEQSTDNTSWSNAAGTNNTISYSPAALTSTMYYRRTATSAMCSADISSSVIVTVLPVLANNTISSAQTICSGQTPLALNGTVPSGGDNTYNYLWEESADNINWSAVPGANNLNSYSPSALTNTMYYRRKVSSAMCSSNISPAIAITILSVITSNSISSAQTICAGESPLTLSGTPPSGGDNTFTFLWEESSDNTAWTAASGTNNLNSYSPSVLTDTMYYRRKVSSAMCSSNTSAPIIITVLPVISNNSVSSSQTICVGQTPLALNGTSASGGDNSYTFLWEESSDNFIWTSAQGVNNMNSYSPSTLATTTYYRRTVSSAMCSSNSSLSIAITVLPLITNNTISSSQTICSGQTPISLNGTTPSGGDNAYIYLWEQSSDSMSWSAAAGTNNLISYSPSSLINTMYFRRIVSSAMCSSDTSLSIRVTVLPVITNNNISSAQTICSGQTPQMLTGTMPSGGDNSFTFMWEQSADNLVWSAAAGTNNLNDYSAAALSTDIYFRRTVSSAMCSSNTSNAVNITVLPVISNNIISSDQAVCNGQTPLALNGSSPSGGDNAYNYLWEQSSDESVWSAAWGTNYLQNYSPGALSDTMYYRRITGSAMCSSDTSMTVEIIVLPMISNNSISSDQTICSGQVPANIIGAIPAGGNNTYIYYWEESADNLNWSAASGLNNLSDYSAGSLTQTIYFRRNINSGACSSQSNSVQITVLPLVGNNTITAMQTICSGQAPAALSGSLPSGGDNAYTYLWEQSSDNVIWTPASGNDTSQNYSPPVLSDTIYYRRKVSSASCSSVMSNAITINVMPVISNNTITADQIICSGSVPSVLNGSIPAGGNNIYSFLWQQSSDSLLWTNGLGINNSQNYGTPALTDTLYLRRIVSSGVCSSDTASVVKITVLPSVTNNIISADQTLCSGQVPAQLTGTLGSGGDNNYSYLWEQSNDGASWSSATGIDNGQNYSPLNQSADIYFRRTINSVACTSQSNVVTITVLPVVSNNTVSAVQTICSGNVPAPLTGTLPSGGNGSFTYLWQQSNDNISWSAAFGTNTSSNYSPASLSSSIYYRRIVNSAMCYADTSLSVFITVLPAVSNNFISSPQTICAGGIPTMLNGSVPSGGNNSYSYTWLQSADSINWVLASGTNNAQNYSPAVLTGSIYFTRVITSSTCISDTSSQVLITVVPAITNNTVSADQTICYGQVPIMLNGSVPAGGDNSFTYLWEESSDSTSWSQAAGVNNLSGYTPSALTSTMYFRRTVNSFTCFSNTSQAVTITVLPPVSNNSISSAQTICNGQTPAALTGSAPQGGNNTYSYSWEQSTDGNVWINANGINNAQNYNPAALIDTVYYRRTVISAMCASDTSSIVVITVLPSISNNTVSGHQIICSAQQATTLTGSSPSGGNNTYSYLWEESPDNTVWGTASGISNQQGYTPPVLADTTYYRRTVSSQACSSLSDSVVITVLPVISNNSLSSQQTICSGQTPLTINGQIPVGGNNSFNYQWEESIDGFVWLGASGINTTQDYVPSALSSTTYYRRIVSSNTCADTSSSTSVFVNPLPTLIMSGSDSICNGDNFNISLMLSGAAPYTITYTDGLNNYAASGISTSQATLNVQPAQSSNFIPVSLVDNNGCYASSISGTANVIVSAIPTANAGPDAEICGLTFDLSALPSLGIGAWVSQSGVTYHDINNAAADVTVPVGGEYIFTWKENNNGCISMDDVKIIFYDQVTANAGDDQDVYFTNTAQLSGIEMPGNKTWSLLSGNGIIASPNDLNSFVHELGSGENVFKLTVVNGVCPATEDEVKLLVHELEIPNSFTPNGDNINDKFVIRNLEHARSNNLKVFNSWGAEIFTAADYMNDWDGTNKDGGPLSPDTYYYVLEINGEMHSGFIVLKR